MAATVQEIEVKTPGKAVVYISQEGGENDENTLDVRINRVYVTPRSMVTKNVMADDLIYHDFKVVMPIEVTVDCTLEVRNENFKETVATIYNMWHRSWYMNSSKMDSTHGVFSMVRSRDGSLWKDLVLESCPHMEDAEHYDVFMFQLKFSQFSKVKDSWFNPRNTVSC